MKLTVLKISKTKSKYGKDFYYIFLKDNITGKSYKTCAYPAFGNFKHNRWDMVVNNGIGGVLEYANLPINNKGLLDADIQFTYYPPKQADFIAEQGGVK